MLIAQLSDLHVRPKGVRYHGVVDSNGGLVEAIEHVLALDRRPDLVIPGNHDDRENFRAPYADHAYLPRNGPLHYCVDDHPVRIVGLDSTVPGQHHGHLDEAGLAWLTATLERDTAKPTLLMLHHPPFVSGIAYMDEYRYFDGDALRTVVERFDDIEIVLCEHVHRPVLKRWANTVICSCPSTATEIDLKLLASAQPSSHGGPRGFMLHLWDER